MNQTSGVISHENPARPADRGIRRPASVRRWARAAVAAQVLFVASWLLAAAWQGPRYSVLAHSISDMYAATAPGGMFLVIVFTLCGAATIGFTLRSAWPVFRRAGWPGRVAAGLLTLSIFGLGDLLTPMERLDCRLADPGCTAAAQLSNSGGTMDTALSNIGLVLFVLAAFFLAAAMRRLPEWRSWAWPSALTGILVVGFGVALGANSGTSGLFERLIAAGGAAGIAVLAAGILRTVPEGRPPEG